MSSDRGRKAQRRMDRQKKRAGPKLPRTPFFIDSSIVDLPRMDLPPTDAELDQLLVERGWALAERDVDGDMYDWPPSISDPLGRYTYVIVDASNRGALHVDRYRAGSESGPPRSYPDRLSLISELDDLESRRT
jgi:hypothetical protein